MRTLKLTSPNMKGPDVKSAQKSLRKYYTGKIDGVYGEATALATKQAKFMLGYRSNNIDSVYDTKFVKYLSGASKPTLLMQQRISARAKKTSLGVAALECAMQSIGVSEHPPGSNKVPFSNWYGINGPWCAMFVTYAFVQAGSKAFKKGERYAYCPYMLADAKAHRNNLTLVQAKDVRTGDIVLFDWKKDGIADHVGIVSFPPGKTTTFTSVEGNTSGTNPSDGGMVAQMTRKTTDVIGFVRVLA